MARRHGWSMGLLLAAWIIAVPASAASAAEGAAGRLVDVDWLAAHRADPELLVLDASPAQAHAAGHVAGAVGVDLMSWYGLQQKTPSEFEALYQSWGISPGKTVVVYDQGGTYFATRLFFSLYHHGFPLDRLFLLDGGFAKWSAAGFPVSTERSPAPPKGTFAIRPVNDNAEAELPEVLAATGDPARYALVEALGPDWHFGQVRPFDRPGHIPGGILLPAADFFNADKTFKSAGEIARMLEYVGVTREQQVITYCGGGVAASVPYFAVRFLLGYPEVKLFTASEMGWLSDERQLPYWTYGAPYLVRSGDWLRAWGGQMMRMYGNARVSVVDVRPAEAYTQGHVPFALNVPAAQFRNALAAPGRLAAQLGPGGVDPAHEAVVVSGGGITPDAALAFVMLAALGQQKVSLFVEPVPRWTELGLKPSAEATAVGPRKGPRDLSIPPTSYAGSTRNGVLITDPSTTRGAYPKVFVASGRSLPARPPEGTVIHVPYADLLDADGMPKPASDIWTLLSKAGVPRYAELVCVADDPGEAAVNYFVLKMMGYPDVKVLAR